MSKTQFVKKESDRFYVEFDDIVSFLKELETRMSRTGRNVYVEFSGSVSCKEV